MALSSSSPVADTRPKATYIALWKIKFQRPKPTKHLDSMSKGRLEGLFRRDNATPLTQQIQTLASHDAIELLDGMGTGKREESNELHDGHRMKNYEGER